MTNPFVNCKLYDTVMLYPHQFDGNYKMHLKQNLIEKLEKKCHKEYGFIDKIYDIVHISDGRIHNDNPMANAMFDIGFSCKLCKPIIKNKILCQVKRISPGLLQADCGPIVVIIPMNRVNTQVFLVDASGKIKIKTNGNMLTPGMYVICEIVQFTFSDTDRIIKAVGYLDNIANDKEVANFFSEMYNETKFIDYEKQFGINELPGVRPPNTL